MAFGQEFKSHLPSELTPLLADVPVFYPSLEMLSERGDLTVHFLGEEKPVEAKSVYASVLVEFDDYLKARYPGWQVVVPIKAYTQVSHGQIADGAYSFITVHRYLQEIEELTHQAARQFNANMLWTAGLSAIFLICPEVDCCLDIDPLENNPFIEFDPWMVLPLADLDIRATDQSKNDLEDLVKVLVENKFSGMVLRSGEPGRGSYHYVADFLLPHHCFWQLMGKLMLILTPDRENLGYLRGWGERMMGVRNWQEAKQLAGEIIEKIPPGTETGSYLDFRWVAHQVEENRAILRTEPAKGYSGGPQLVVEIY